MISSTKGREKLISKRATVVSTVFVYPLCKLPGFETSVTFFAYPPLSDGRCTDTSEVMDIASLWTTLTHGDPSMLRQSLAALSFFAPPPLPPSNQGQEGSNSLPREKHALRCEDLIEHAPRKFRGKLILR